MKGKNLIIIGLVGIVLIVLLGTLLTGGSDLNTIGNPHFTKDGHLIQNTAASNDSISGTPAVISNSVLEEKEPSQMKFYVEVSGSMNGFFRANLPTGFKKDVCSVFTFEGFTNKSDGVNIMSNNGEISGHYGVTGFIDSMSKGNFVSTAETKVPTMLQSIINDINLDRNEVAVLVSDMKFSPEMATDMGVQISFYPSLIRNVVDASDATYCLIAATSNYLDKTGCSIADKSPYYYLVIGTSETVSWTRNKICTLLEHNNSYVEEIECGFDYGTPSYEFGIPKGAVPLVGEPTFYDIVSGMCEIPMTVDITNYRWILANEECFKECFKVTSTMGSTVEVADIKIADDHAYGKQLCRKATASLTLKVSGMLQQSDVIEWTIEIPETTVNGQFSSFLGAQSEKEYDKSFSIDGFIDGMFKGSKNTWQTEPNRILISKNS